MGAPKGGNKGSFKKGQNPNPAGRKPLPEAIRNITYHTKPQIIEAYWKVANLTIDQAKQFKPKNLIEAGILRCVVDFARSGRTAEISKVWAECHGRPRENFDINLNASVADDLLTAYESIDEADTKAD